MGRLPVRRRRKLVWRKGRVAIFAVAGASIFVAMLFFFQPVRQLVTGISATIAMGSGPLNVLLIANNARGVAASNPLGLGTAAGQADVILLLRLDPGAHTIYAITVPRDALVPQPRWHNPVPKIKTLFFMGDQETPPRGPQYLAEAVSALTGLPVNGYIVSNFAGFKEAVDLVGGLTVDVKARIYDPQFSGAIFEPGVQHMTGSQALAFIRVRQNHAGNSYRVNDFQRMQAEVEVLGLLRNKLLDPAHAAALVPSFVSKMRRNIATDLPNDRLVRIGIAMAGAPVFQVPLGSIADSMLLAPVEIPGINAEGRIDESYYDVLDPAAVQTRLAEFGSRPSPEGLPALPPPQSLRIDLHGTQHLALHLEHLGFRGVRIVGPPTGDDVVVYPVGHPASGWQVARAVGTGSFYVRPGPVDDVTVFE
jgi:LCP family protein required for cell wall assembly